MAQPIELDAEALRRRCNPDSFDFDTTANLPTLTEVLGQPRALAALEFGTAIASHDFNLFALGQPGSGKTTLIRNYLEHQASTQPVPPDLCYVYNFSNARSPVPLRLPPGQAAQLKNDIDALVDELRTEIPRAFDTAEYSRRRDQIVQDLESKRRKELAESEERVSQAGFQLVKGPGGLLLAPALGGRLLTEEDLGRLTPEEREKVLRVSGNLQREIEDRWRTIRELERGTREALHALDTETATLATHHLIEGARHKSYGL